MLKNFVMPENCLTAIAKSRQLFTLDKLIEVLKPWHRIANYTNDILIYLQKNSPLSEANPEHLDLSFKAKQKAVF